MIRSIHSPLNSPGSLQSKPSSARNRTVSSRSSTTRPMWTKLVTPGRWLSIEVKRLARDRRAAGVVRVFGPRARTCGAPASREIRASLATLDPRPLGDPSYVTTRYLRWVTAGASTRRAPGGPLPATRARRRLDYVAFLAPTEPATTGISSCDDISRELR